MVQVCVSDVISDTTYGVASGIEAAKYDSRVDGCFFVALQYARASYGIKRIFYRRNNGLLRGSCGSNGNAWLGNPVFGACNQYGYGHTRKFNVRGLMLC